VTLFSWSEEEFLERTAGSAIRRAGYRKWLRNIAVALGNAPGSEEIVQALRDRRDFPDETVQEHVQWALQRHTQT
jgi:epoxyqueuosine reductase